MLCIFEVGFVAIALKLGGLLGTYFFDELWIIFVHFYPGVWFQKLLDGFSLPLISLEALKNEIFAFFGDFVPVQAVESDLLTQSIAVDFLDRMTLEWGLSAQK